MKEKVIARHGGYRRLKSFQIAQLVYDVTVRFCDRYIDVRSRTHDQMVQAARSGVQNIAEGSKASATSKKFELKLTSVARASLEELRLDYEDFLRHRDLPQWQRQDPRRQSLIDSRPTTADEVAAWAKQIHDGSTVSTKSTSTKSTKFTSTKSTPSTKSIVHQPSSLEIVANGALTLISVASALLDRQLASLARAFERDGGFTERLYRIRTASRS